MLDGVWGCQGFAWVWMKQLQTQTPGGILSLKGGSFLIKVSRVAFPSKHWWVDEKGNFLSVMVLCLGELYCLPRLTSSCRLRMPRLGYSSCFHWWAEQDFPSSCPAFPQSSNSRVWETPPNIWGGWGCTVGGQNIAQNIAKNNHPLFPFTETLWWIQSWRLLSPPPQLFISHVICVE